MSIVMVSEGAGEKSNTWYHEEAKKLLSQKNKMYRVLRLHGTPVQNEEKTSSFSKYEICLFQHHVLRIYKTQDKTIWIHQSARTIESTIRDEVSNTIDETERKKMVSYAIRALYSLGLEYGTIYIGVHSNNRMYVMDCLADLPEDDQLHASLDSARVKLEQQMMLDKIAAPTVMLGADPEFALQDEEGNMAIASHYLMKVGRVGYDGARLRNDPLSNQHPLVEVRPDPSIHPEEVFLNIYKALRLAQRKISHLKWLAGGMPFDGYPIGGHVHFSGTPLHFGLLRKLDTYLCLPLALLEDERCIKRRPRYGFLGDFREQDYGGFEYRTLPSWLISPRIAKGVLTLAKIIAESQYLLKKEATRDITVQLAFYRGEKEKLRMIVRELYQEIIKLPMYKKYRQFIMPFFHSVFTEGEWQANSDIKEMWKLPPSSPQQGGGSVL